MSDVREETVARSFGGELAGPGSLCGQCADRRKWLYPVTLPKGTFNYAEYPHETEIRVCADCYREIVDALRKIALRHSSRLLKARPRKRRRRRQTSRF